MTKHRSKKAQSAVKTSDLIGIAAVCIVCGALLIVHYMSQPDRSAWPHGLSKLDYLDDVIAATFVRSDNLEYITQLDQTILPPFELDPLVGQCIHTDPCMGCPCRSCESEPKIANP